MEGLDEGLGRLECFVGCVVAVTVLDDGSCDVPLDDARRFVRPICIGNFQGYQIVGESKARGPLWAGAGTAKL